MNLKEQDVSNELAESYDTFINSIFLIGKYRL